MIYTGIFPSYTAISPSYTGISPSYTGISRGNTGRTLRKGVFTVNYMKHFERVDDLITVLGDFPLLEGELERAENGFRFSSDTLEVVSTFETHPSGVTVRRDSIRNCADRPLTVRTALSKFVFNGGEYEAYTQYDENNAEGQAAWLPLMTEVSVRGKELRCSFENAPFLALRDTGSGRGMVFHVFENCLWTIRARRVIRQKGQKKTVTVEAGVDSANFSLTLAPGETFRLPALLSYPFRNRLDMDAYKLHRFCNATLARKPLPVVYNTWMSKFDDISYDELARQLPIAKRLGMEYFVIDAGWFGEPFHWHASVGDWREYEAAGMAGRMREFADLVRGSGLKFGLWFEIERAELTSEAYRAHPEYYITEKEMGFLNFAVPEARDFAFETVKQNIEKYGIEYIKFDFNGTATYDANAQAFLPYFEGYREFIRCVRAAYPDIYIEGCASGGQRIAPATLEFFDSYWLTDQQDIHDQMDIYTATVRRMPNRALETWITVQSMPDFTPCYRGGKVDKLLTGDGNWAHIERTTQSYVLASMLGGPLGISCDLTRLTEEVLAALEAQIACFKAERDFWGNSECRILADTESLTVLQYNDPDFSEIKLHVYVKKFRRNAVTVYPVCAAGRTYLREDGTKIDAARLEEEGIELPLKTPHTAACASLTAL